MRYISCNEAATSARLPSLNGLRAFEAAARHLSLHQRRAGIERHPDRDQPSDPAAGGRTQRVKLFVRQSRSLAGVLTPQAAEYLPGIRAAGPAHRHRPAAAQGSGPSADGQIVTSFAANGCCRA